MIDLRQCRRDADGWRGTFYALRTEAVDGASDVVYVAHDEVLDPDNEETFFVISECLDDHVADSLVRMLNAYAALVEAAEVNAERDELAAERR